MVTDGSNCVWFRWQSDGPRFDSEAIVDTAEGRDGPRSRAASPVHAREEGGNARGAVGQSDADE